MLSSFQPPTHEMLDSKTSPPPLPLFTLPVPPSSLISYSITTMTFNIFFYSQNSLSYQQIQLRTFYTKIRQQYFAFQRTGRGVDHLPPSSAEVKVRVELYILLPLWAFMACPGANFYFVFQCHGISSYNILVFLSNMSKFSF